MLLDLILIIALSVFIYLYVDRNAQLKKQVFTPKEALDVNAREEVDIEDIMRIKETDNRELFDPLTGLPNNSIFEEKLKQIFKYSKQHQQLFSVMLLNIDDFGNFNKVLGHDFSDKLLMIVAKRLRSVIRQIDMASRYAGDTFILLLPQLTKAEVATYVAQRIQDSITQPFTVDEQKIFLTACIGISINSADETDPNKMIDNAKEALNRAKAAGKNTYRMSKHDLDELDDKELNLTDYLESISITENLVMYYQPFVETDTNKIIHIQAIPYLRHPDLDLIPFTEFFRAAEDCGKISEIGDWQFRQSLLQFKKWQTEGIPLEKLVLTISLKQLSNEHFIYNFSHLLQEIGMEPQQIIFDVAEHSIVLNDAIFKKALTSASQLGVKIAISIITLGRLALHKISELPINYLKIDAKLVKGLLIDIENESLITTIIDVAKDSNVNILAEGVDYENQKLRLMELGCHVVQGKLLYVPQRAEVLSKSLQTTDQSVS